MAKMKFLHDQAEAMSSEPTPNEKRQDALRELKAKCWIQRNGVPPPIFDQECGA